MRLSKLALVIGFILSYSLGYAQVTPSKKIKRVSLHDFNVQTGLFVERNTNVGVEEFKSLAPQSVLLQNNLQNYAQFNGNSTTGNNAFSVMLGLKFSNKEKQQYKSNPTLRLGITYFAGSTLTSSYSKGDRTLFDTLTSSQTGQTILVDSVVSQSYNMNYSAEQLRFDGSLIFRTNPEARWSFFTGIGVMAGLSINAQTTINYNKRISAETRNSNSTYLSLYDYSDSFSSIDETFRNSSNFGFTGYIPMGVDFRIGKKKEFWKRTHLFIELRPAINITSIPELRTFANTGLQQGLGLRVLLH
jgi:hypothetical protein